MKFVRVTAPYVTLKVRDHAGAWTVNGVYAGAVFRADHVEAESLQHHVDSGMAEVFDAPADGDEPEAGTIPDAAVPKVEELKPDLKPEEPKKAAPVKKTGSSS